MFKIIVWTQTNFLQQLNKQDGKNETICYMCVRACVCVCASASACLSVCLPICCIMMLHIIQMSHLEKRKYAYLCPNLFFWQDPCNQNKNMKYLSKTAINQNIKMQKGGFFFTLKQVSAIFWNKIFNFGLVVLTLKNIRGPVLHIFQ